jgi:methionyl-tRNA formyltransferase
MAGPAHLRTVFAGTPGFAIPAFELLVRSGFPPVAVLTQPDRPAGRGRKLQASPVKVASLAAGIPVHQPPSLKDPGFVTWLTGVRPDLLIVVAYGLILPGTILGIPKYGCWNIHASLLPRWRGAAPIQRAIEAGDEETGVCIMQMDTGLDTGPVLVRDVEKISADDTAGSLQDRLAKLGAESLLRSMQQLATGALPKTEAQASTGVTWAAKLEKSEAELDWGEGAMTLERKVRAFNPWPVAWCDIAGERTRIWLAKALPAQSGARSAQSGALPGTVIAATAAGIDISTAAGTLRCLRLQRPGGRQLSSAEYLKARPHLTVMNGRT